MYRCRQLFGGQAEGIGARGSILLSSSQEMVLVILAGLGVKFPRIHGTCRMSVVNIV